MLSVAKFTFNPFQENTYVVHNGSQALLIDPGCYNTAEERELEAWLAENALTPARLVLTHAHIDHVFGCAWAHRRYGLLPELHPADHTLLKGAPQVARMYGLPFEEGAGPGGELVQGGTITLGDDRLEILFVPGHAPGHVALFSTEQRFVIAGDVLFREGDPFEAIAAVRAGTVKTCVTDRDGNEHVQGFHFPGEVIGLNAIDGHLYPCDAVALDTVMLCRFSFPKISVLAARVPGLQRELFRLLSRDIGRAALLAGDWTADQRVAAFLVGMSRRLSARGFSAVRFQLTMARTDIANYLRLAPETVSRVLRRMQDDGLLAVERRDVSLLDRDRIEALAAPILRE